MPTNKTHLKKAIYSMFNEVIEQSFRQMINFPEEGDNLNQIIKDATDELNHLTMKVDNHHYPPGSKDLQRYYDEISNELNLKSLDLLGRLQGIQRHVRAKTS